MDLSLHFGRFLAGALISALLAVGGVWFVVDISLRGLEAAVETTNKRIDDLKGEINSNLALQIENLELRLKAEFEQTRAIIQKAEVDPSSSQVPAPQYRQLEPDFATAGFTVRKKAGDLSAADWLSTTVIGADAKIIGKVAEVIEREAGSPEAIVVDIDENLGLGTKSVAIEVPKNPLYEDSKGNFFFYASISSQAIADAKAYEASAYRENPSAMRLPIN